MIIPTTSEKNLKLLLARLNECSFDTYNIEKSSTKWILFSTGVDSCLRTRIISTAMTTREIIIALCVVLDTMRSIRDKSFNDGYQSAMMDAETPDRGAKT